MLGRLYQVNAKHAELAGRPCFPSLAALPEVPDCVVIATGRDAVAPIVADCARLGAWVAAKSLTGRGPVAALPRWVDLPPAWRAGLADAATAGAAPTAP